MYYGGDPPDWTASPGLPVQALYGAEPPSPSPPPLRGPQQLEQHKTVKAGAAVSKAHPLAGVGGYQMPAAGKIGGAKGAGQMTGSSGVDKRKHEDSTLGKPVSREEAEAWARREAARKRVEARTMAAFGLQ